MKSFLINVDLLRVFCKLFYLRFYVLSDQWKNKFEKHFYTEVIVTLIPTNLISNRLLSFFFLLWKAKTGINVLGCWLCGNKNCFCFLFKASCLKRIVLVRKIRRKHYSVTVKKDSLLCLDLGSSPGYTLLIS